MAAPGRVGEQATCPDKHGGRPDARRAACLLECGEAACSSRCEGGAAGGGGQEGGGECAGHGPEAGAAAWRCRGASRDGRACADSAPDPGAEARHTAELSRLRALPLPEACAALRAYLIAATAKDCSLMLTLQAAPPPAGRDSPGSAGAAAHAQPAGSGRGAGAAGAEARARSGGGPASEADEGAGACEGRAPAHGEAGAPGERGAAAAAGTPRVLARQADACAGGLVEVAATGPGGGRARLRYKLALVDLDRKPLAKVHAHWRLDQAILAAAAACP